MATETEEKSANPLVSCLQQDLYEGKTGDSTTEEGNQSGPQPSGWWAFEYDPSEPTQMTMLVTLEAAQGSASKQDEEAGNCLSYYSSRLSVAEVQSLYQWLALQMGQQMAASGKKKAGSKDNGSKNKSANDK